MANPSIEPNGHQLRRDILPIPDVKHVGLTTYDAKDPTPHIRRLCRCDHLRARPMC
jgi:hypothetical protein